MGNPCRGHAIIALSILLLQISTQIIPCTATKKPVFHGSTKQTHRENIRTSCRRTTYPRLCLKSLFRHATKTQADPKLLAHAALNASLAAAQTTSRLMKELSRTHGFNPNQAAAIQDCVADIKDSVKELQKSVTGTDSDAKMRSGASDFQVQLREIQAWVRTALEEEELCMHAFPVKGMKGKLKTVVRGRIVKTAHLTSNALALVNQYALAKPN